MGIAEVSAFFTTAKNALDIFKGIRSELPQSPAAEKAQRQIEEAEGALQRSEVELAKALGYKLCQCTFLPQIMLWRQQENAYVCPNPKCGRKLSRPSRRVLSNSYSGWLDHR